MAAYAQVDKVTRLIVNRIEIDDRPEAPKFALPGFLLVPDPDGQAHTGGTWDDEKFLPPPDLQQSEE